MRLLSMQQPILGAQTIDHHPQARDARLDSSHLSFCCLAVIGVDSRRIARVEAAVVGVAHEQLAGAVLRTGEIEERCGVRHQCIGDLKRDQGLGPVALARFLEAEPELLARFLDRARERIRVSGGVEQSQPRAGMVDQAAARAQDRQSRARRNMEELA